MSYNSFTTFSDSRSSLPRPSIVEVIEQSGVHLRRAGREFVGLCPFHSEKGPSFYVNEEKGVFHCYGCQEGGDVIAFVMKAEGLGFKGALEHLGLEDSPPRSRDDQGTRNEAAEIVAWAEMVSVLVADKLRLLGQQQRILWDIPDKDLARWKLEGLRRQWELLTIMDEDLSDPDKMVELWKEREIVVGLLAL